MALKKLHTIFIILWLSLSLLLLVFHVVNNFKSNITFTYSSLSNHHLINRKVFISKLDFTPIQNHPQQQHKKRSRDMQVQPAPSGNQIDLRYGVEKRLVPTGPNPLHH
ncbi:hypothetical protein CFOL_v3_20954 [Cephalotus follicularis]|uniref:Uncharacterized protein n=1 Tax=Cephalotus follicularis TaxID=3775 RepID=A0A1Q3CBK6_CEPFO|nr:hypothetical protein CFOL_v3_20954 [Cephalotus follicularis]